MFKIMGYGNTEPLSKGVEIVKTNDAGYAEMIALALAEKYPGQIFGMVSLLNGTRRMWKRLPLQQL